MPCPSCLSAAFLSLTDWISSGTGIFLFFSSLCCTSLSQRIAYTISPKYSCSIFLERMMRVFSTPLFAMARQMM